MSAWNLLSVKLSRMMFAALLIIVAGLVVLAVVIVRSTATDDSTDLNNMYTTYCQTDPPAQHC